MSDELAEPVHLYVYDLTMGMARQLSPMLLGKKIEGVWHSGLVVGGVEHFYGYGLQRTAAGRTPFGKPYQVIELGTTSVPEELRQDMLEDLAQTFTPQAYNLLFHNCNHFSNEFSLLLTGNGIPEYILAQAQEVLNTPMGEMLMPMLMQMEVGLGHVTAGGLSPANQGPAQHAPSSSQIEMLSTQSTSSTLDVQSHTATTYSTTEVAARASISVRDAESESNQGSRQSSTSESLLPASGVNKSSHDSDAGNGASPSKNQSKCPSTVNSTDVDGCTEDLSALNLQQNSVAKRSMEN